MAGRKLDGAGTAKMNTLDDAVLLHQRIHGLVETYALSVKQNKPAGSIMQNLKRQMPALAGKLKGQFGMISDLVTSVNMQMTRGSSEQMRVRVMRDGVAAIKAQLDIAFAQTLAKHEIRDDIKGGEAGEQPG
jgi:hypothetical protein